MLPFMSGVYMKFIMACEVCKYNYQWMLEKNLLKKGIGMILTKLKKKNLFFVNLNNPLELYTALVEIHKTSKCRVQKDSNS